MVPRCIRWNTAGTQVPSSKEAPNLNPQRKARAMWSQPKTGVEVWGLEILWSLEFGI